MNGPFRTERGKKFFDPFLDISSRFWGKFFFMKISENPGPLPGGGEEFVFLVFFFFRRFTFSPPPPKLALGLITCFFCRDFGFTKLPNMV